MSSAADRPTAAGRGYGARWQRARELFLAANPLCRMCERMGRTTPSTVVDHVVPHRGDLKLFWRRSNWQPLCGTCHNSVKQREEKGEGPIGCDEEGIPLDPNHPWNRAAREET